MQPCLRNALKLTVFFCLRYDCVNRSLQYGDGGYEIVFGRLKEQAEKSAEEQA